MNERMGFSASLRFESVSLPPFRDILVLGRKCPHGKTGMMRCMHLLSPDDFELIEVEDEDVEAILVSRALLKRLSPDRILGLLSKRVFPYMVSGETVKVDLDLQIFYEEICEMLDGGEKKNGSESNYKEAI